VPSNWLVVLLVAIAALVLRWQGDSWAVVVGKLMGLVVLFLAVVAILGVVIARLS
jgi:small neutral amino acid transporter SnatA (MarC family)